MDRLALGYIGLVTIVIGIAALGMALTASGKALFRMVARDGWPRWGLIGSFVALYCAMYVILFIVVRP